jgi:tetratricopeptide (TPR) repeat protein
VTDDAFEAVIVRNGRRIVARQAVPGESRAEAIAATVHLAELLAERDPDAAIQVYEQVLDAQRAEHAPIDPLTRRRLERLADLRRRERRADEMAAAVRSAELLAEQDPDAAIRAYEQVLDAQQAERGPTHPETARTLEHLAHLLRQEGRLPEARDRFRELAAAVDAMFGPRHPETLGVLSDLATVLQQLGELRQASELYATVLPALLDLSGPDDHLTAVCANNYAVLLLGIGAHEEARSWFTVALPGLERHYGADAHIVVSARADLAECEAITGRAEDPAAVRRGIEARRPPPPAVPGM